MTTTAKAQKEKPYGVTPRLTPRPTAASAARAARNATNRNLTVSAVQRQSPSRTPSSPVFPKGKNLALRNVQKSDSKMEIKINKLSEYEVSTVHDVDVSFKQEIDTYIIDNGVEVVNKSENDSVPENNQPKILELKHLNGGSEIFEIKHDGVTNDDTVTNDAESDYVAPMTEFAKSRPQTPARGSRPPTPRSVGSRPQTPRTNSRPHTPAHPAQQLAISSRPNTPQRASPSTPRTPSTLPVPSPVRVQTPVSMCHRPRSPTIEDEEDLKSIFATKRLQFNRMKKELDLKQQAILEVFDYLRKLSERMLREGISFGADEGLHQQELMVFNVADWTTDEVAQLCKEATASFSTGCAVDLINTIIPIDENALAELDSKVIDLPTRFVNLCLQAYSARQELIDWVKELVEQNEDGSGESMERVARYNAQGLELCESLRDLKQSADDAVDTIIQLTRRACRERSALAVVSESLIREVARLHQDLDARANIINEMREIRAETETAKLLEENRRELEEERAARNATKDKLANTEAQLRQTRIRVTKMDRQLREAEASIASLTGTVKSLEDQSRQREVQLEARARKLKESLKTGEVASNQLAQQRDTLQTEIAELKEQISEMTAQHKSTIDDLNNQLNDLKYVFEEQKRLTQKERELKETAEFGLAESQNRIEELKNQITDLENSRPNPDLPTEREMDLWAELHAIKETLRVAEEEVNACKKEKVRFLETLTKITESENKVGMQQKLAAELISKEEIIGKMQIQIRELTKNIKLNEQKVLQYEQYVRDLQAHNRAVANCQEAPNGISYQDLQQEIMNLRMGLLEAVHRNEELSEMLAQKEQQLEQQDKTSRAQARVIKVREELINMLKNKETEQSRELAALQQDLEHRMKIVDEVNKQIAAKADEIQELFTTLENKQQQIHRLEKIVLALEEQQRRAQAQRTRHEEKIAALEHELAAGGNRRERKFIFF